MVAHYIDSGVEDYSVEAAISKVFASEAIQRSAYEALQIAAGNGFMREYPYEQVDPGLPHPHAYSKGPTKYCGCISRCPGLKDVGKSLGELRAAVDEIFNHPIKGFGVLTDYAEKRLTHATGVGRDKIRGSDSAELREATAMYEKYTVELAKASDHLLRKYGKSIAGRQHALKRVADIAIDLFVGLCVLSRATSLAAEPGEEGDRRRDRARCSRGKRSAAWPTTCAASCATRTRR